MNVHGSEDGGQERLTLRGKGGAVELQVLLTDAGPRLIFESAELDLHATAGVNIRCEQFAVQARQRASIQAAELDLEASVGDVQVRANDGVSLVGEEVRLNCDKPEEIPEWMRADLLARFMAELQQPLPASQVTGDTSLVEEFDRLRAEKDP